LRRRNREGGIEKAE
jgi:hypothetical protein